jgi:hypothetical protein
MTAKLTDRERWRRELSSAAPPSIATDALADLIFSLILDREAELVAEAEAGFGCCPRAASTDRFTKRSNAALASAMIWNGRPAA